MTLTRLRLFKIAAEVRLSARRIWVRYSNAYPWKDIFNTAWPSLLNDIAPCN